MSDQTSQAVTANPEALLRQGLDLLQECRETLTTMEPGRLDAYSIQLEDAVESLQSAALSLDSSQDGAAGTGAVPASGTKPAPPGEPV